MPRPIGTLIETVEGLKISVARAPSKTGKGKDRIWVSVRQDEPKKWRLAASLSYVNAFDVRFERSAKRR